MVHKTYIKMLKGKYKGCKGYHICKTESAGRPREQVRVQTDMGWVTLVVKPDAYITT